MFLCIKLPEFSIIKIFTCTTYQIFLKNSTLPNFKVPNLPYKTHTNPTQKSSTRKHCTSHRAQEVSSVPKQPLALTMKNLFFSMVVILSVLFLVGQVTDAAVSCGTVTVKAAPCLNYARGVDSVPSPQCCSGLTALATSAKTLDDKKGICNCMKNAVKNIKGVQDKYLSKIPTACNIKVNFPVSLSVNCDK